MSCGAGRRRRCWMPSCGRLQGPGRGWEGPRDDIPVEGIDALIRSARSSGDRAGVDTSSGGQPPERGGAGDLLRVRPRHGHPPYGPPSRPFRQAPVQHRDLLVEPLERVGTADLAAVGLGEGEVGEQPGLGAVSYTHLTLPTNREV